MTCASVDDVSNTQEVYLTLDDRPCSHRIFFRRVCYVAGEREKVGKVEADEEEELADKKESPRNVFCTRSILCLSPCNYICSAL